MFRYLHLTAEPITKEFARLMLTADYTISPGNPTQCPDPFSFLAYGGQWPTTARTNNCRVGQRFAARIVSAIGGSKGGWGGFPSKAPFFANYRLSPFRFPTNKQVFNFYIHATKSCFCHLFVLLP